MRLNVTKASASSSYNGLGDQLYDLGGARPTLDLNFSSNESLVDSVTGKTLVDHTRQSSATYVDGDGVIRTAVTNLLLQSEDFSTTWTRTGVLAFGSGSIVNAIAAPDGQVSADLITEDTSTGFHRIGQAFNYAANTVYMFSVYAKAETRSKLNLQLGSGLFKISLFDLTAGTATGDGVIQPVGNGWYRCSLFSSNTVSGASTAYVEITNDSDQRSYTGDGTSGIYIWGAQLEQSGTVGQYVKTTTAKNGAPRFDHDPTTGESLGLLIEESRTNNALYSDDFNNGAWFKQSGHGLTPNTTIAPDGTQTADTFNRGAFNQYIYQSIGITGTYTMSVWVKTPSGAGNLDFVMQHYNPTNGGLGVTTFTATEEWQRFHITASPTAVGGWYPCIPTTLSQDYHVWGAQLEAGSFPTSYIPTEGSTVTRAADVASIEGRNFGSVNLLQYSEEFDQAGWTNAGTFTWTPSTDLAPDGSLTVDKPSVVFTYWGFYDVTNVAWLSGYPAAFPFTVTSSWTRQSVTITAPAGCTSLRFYPGRVGGAGSYLYQTVTVTPGTTYTASAYYKLDSASSTVLVWGAQLEEGSTATDYIKSDVNFTSRGSTATYYDVNGVIQTAAIDEARTAAYLPDGNGNFVSAGDLLLEGAGTNLLTYSEEFDDASWNNSGTLITANTGSAPNGTATADTLISNVLSVYRTFASSAQTYTASLFVKQIDAGSVILSLVGGGAGLNGGVEFDFSTNTAETFGTGATVSSQIFGNGWYRIIATLTATGAASPQFRAQVSGDGSCYIWGAQLEQSSYATSYIPTSGSTATRAADVSTSAATFGNSWYEQSEGTVLWSGIRASTTGYPARFRLWDGTSANTIYSYWDASVNSSTFSIVSSSVSQVAIYGGQGALNTKVTSAFGIKENDISVYYDGVLRGSDLSVTIPIINQAELGGALTGHLSRFTYWPTRLSNDTLQTITV